MSRSAAVDFARPVVSFAPSPVRRWIALRAALAIGLPLTGLTLAGFPPQQVFLAGLGVFAVLYGAGAPVRRRLRTIPGAGVGLLASLALGIATADHPFLAVSLMALVATVATFLTYSLQIGPPAGFFFALDVGIGNLAASHGADPRTILGIAAVGVLSAIVVGTADLWVGAHGVEKAAVASAEELIEAYIDQTDPSAIARSRRTASAALNRAWTAVTDGGSEDRFGGRLQRMHSRYATAVSRAVGGPDDEVTAELALYEAASARQVSLGRPRARWSLRQALRWPSEDLLVAIRVLVAGLVAGTIALALDNAHAYWAAAFAVLIVHSGGTRRAQLQRSFQRTVGTAAGLLAFGLVLRLDPGHWALIALVVGLQFVVEMLVTRNYAAAVVFLTPLALSISMSVTDMDLSTIVYDRGIDTVVGVGVALVVVMVSGTLGRPELLLRAHARRVVLALDDVLADLVERRTRTPEGMDAHLHHCRQLYVELLASDQVATRALADAPRAVAPYREMEQLLAHIGYLVLGATWNPRMRGERERMALARERLGGILDHKVSRTRSAAAIAAELRSVEEALTGS
ncbi:FUSC family protein [Janibacter alittae]|uniref:FUSC family protein n=1 Tax=Janibacter alittae TaxID=3115209 RepID=A0ABZ2MDL6_9MICO